MSLSLKCSERLGSGRANGCCFGFTLIAPHTHYPAHAHPAIELYLVIAGAATWGLGDAPAEIRPPGSVIVHPSGAPHAMTTGAEPLLALFTWRGDLATSPSYV
jgi:quercetin dioxygenase-like cupin family protein